MCIYECDLVCGDDCIVIKFGRDGNGVRVNWKLLRIEIVRCNICLGYGVIIGSEVSVGVSDVYIYDIDFF